MPARACTEREAFPAGKDALFPRCRQFIGRVEKLRCPGNYFCYLPRAGQGDRERELIEPRAKVTFAEDFPVVERLDQGLASRGYAAGR